MAYLFAPRTSFKELPIFFNVEGAVGAQPAVNIREDVLLVQFNLSFIVNTPAPTYTPEMIAACKAITLNGIADQQTITAIKEYQKLTPGSVVDGRVSPAQGYSYNGAVLWSIAAMNDSLQNRCLDVWPRIDKVPGCPAALAEMTKRTVVGV
jgi:hypothetical protein